MCCDNQERKWRTESGWMHECLVSWAETGDAATSSDQTVDYMSVCLKWEQKWSTVTTAGFSIILLSVAQLSGYMIKIMRSNIHSYLHTYIHKGPVPIFTHVPLCPSTVCSCSRLQDHRASQFFSFVLQRWSQTPPAPFTQVHISPHFAEDHYPESLSCCCVSNS